VSFTESEAASWAPAPFLHAMPSAARGDDPLRLHRHDDDDRELVEALIAGVYRRHFDARLRDFMPLLVSRSAGSAIPAAHAAALAAAPEHVDDTENHGLPRPTAVFDR